MKIINKINLDNDIIHIDISKVEFNRAITKQQ